MNNETLRATTTVPLAEYTNAVTNIGMAIKRVTASLPSQVVLTKGLSRYITGSNKPPMEVSVARIVMLIERAYVVFNFMLGNILVV